MLRCEQIAFDFAENVGQITSVDAIMAKLSDAAGEFGMNSFCLGGLPDPGESSEGYVMLNGWPMEWYERYISHDYVHVDPVIRRVRQSTLPFMWHDALYDPSQDTSAHRIMNEAKDFKLVDGFCVPIYSVSGFQACLTFGADKVDLSERAMAALHLIAIYAHARARELLMRSDNRAAKRALQLTVREVECLKWCSAGKSNWEIGMILSISERTVEQHILSAKHKLGVVNRTQAVAEAIRARIIH